MRARPARHRRIRHARYARARTQQIPWRGRPSTSSGGGVPWLSQPRATLGEGSGTVAECGTSAPSGKQGFAPDIGEPAAGRMTRLARARPRTRLQKAKAWPLWPAHERPGVDLRSAGRRSSRCPPTPRADQRLDRPAPQAHPHRKPKPTHTARERDRRHPGPTAMPGAYQHLCSSERDALGLPRRRTVRPRRTDFHRSPSRPAQPPYRAATPDSRPNTVTLAEVDPQARLEPGSTTPARPNPLDTPPPGAPTDSSTARCPPEADPRCFT